MSTASTLSKIVVLWVWLAVPGTMADIPRAKGWHIWGSYPNFEACAEAISNVREDRRRNGLTANPLLAACKIKNNAWTSPLLVMHDGSDTMHWRWVLWRYHANEWTLFGRRMTPGWFSLSVWDSLRGCETAMRMKDGVPSSKKKCLRADKFPGENANLLMEHSDVSGDLGQAG